MTPEYYRQLYEYNSWANHELWKCAMQLTDAQWDEDLHYSIGTVRRQLTHTMQVEAWWLRFLKTGEIVFLENDYSFNHRDAIHADWDGVEAANLDYIASLTDAELHRTVKPFFWEETDPPIHVWQALSQVLNHSTDHRAQTLAGLHRLGGPTFEQDYVYYLTTRGEAEAPITTGAREGVTR